MKRLRMIALVILLVFALSACSGAETLSFGTGGEGGNYYVIGTKLSGLLSADNKISANVKTTAGSAANLRLIQQGFLDIAIVQGDTLLDAFKGKGAFENLPCEGVRALAGLYAEQCQIIVRADSGINSVAELYGKRISVGETESGVVKNAEHILFVNGLSFDSAEVSYLSFSDSADALEKGEIDAFFCTAGAPVKAVSQLADKIDISLVPLDERTIERLVKEFTGYTECTIPAGTYRGQSSDVKTAGVKAVLVAGTKLSDTAAEVLLDTVFGNAEELGFRTPELKFAADDISVPFHNGAARWYKSKGITAATYNGGSVGSVFAAGQD